MDWLAEFRQAYVLFARLQCPPVGDEAGALRAGQTILDAAEAVRAEGGTLLQVCRDDKGMVLVAAWGLASSGWEDAAERAVLAAQSVAATGAAAAGAGGKVFAGLVGGDIYQQYVVVGDAINRAAGMAMLAPEPVTLDTATAQAAARRFEIAPIARLPLKGRDGTAPVHGIVAERLRAMSHAGALIGRAGEKARLGGFARRIARGERSDWRSPGMRGWANRGWPPGSKRHWTRPAVRSCRSRATVSGGQSAIPPSRP